MTALTNDRNTFRKDGDRRQDPVKAATKLYAGGIVCLDATGYAVPGATSTTLTARGVAYEQADNGAGLDGDITVESQVGTYCFVNDGTDTVDRTHIGGTAYIVDDQTVAATDGTGTRSALGKIIDVDARGVWVEIA